MLVLLRDGEELTKSVDCCANFIGFGVAVDRRGDVVTIADEGDFLCLGVVFVVYVGLFC